MDVVAEDRLLAESHLAGRECGECSACCTVLAVNELLKPMRWACDHVACGGCRVYEARPKSCRDFNCLWLRGAIPGDESRRPDNLGVMFDCFHSKSTNELRFVAFELWNGAFDEPAAANLLAEIGAGREVQLAFRDGTWQTIGANPNSA